MDLSVKKADIAQNKKGSAIAYALVIIAMISIIISSMVRFIVSNYKSAYHVQSKEEAFQIAEAGVNFYRWYLAHETDGRTATQVRDFWQSTDPYPYGLTPNGQGGVIPYEREYVDAQGGAIGKYSIALDPVDLSSTIVYANIEGWTYKYPDVKRKLRVRFRRPSWSEDSVLANDFMRFGEGTTVNGKIHSNSGIRFDGVATNVVSSSLSTYNDPDHSGGVEFGVHTHVTSGGNVNENFIAGEAPPNSVPSRPEVFNAGRKFPAPQVDFASLVSDIAYMRSQAAVRFDNSGAGRRIILKADGTYDSCKVNAFDSSNAITGYAGVIAGATGSFASTNGTACLPVAPLNCCNLSTCPWIQSNKTSKGKCVTMVSGNIPQNGIIFVANNVWLEGTVNDRRVSIVAAELSDEPVGGGIGNTGGHKNVFLGMNNLLYTNFDGRDIIGVIAQKDVEVIRDSLNNLTIDAALLAKEGRVGREAYGRNKSTITVNGSIATYARYGFAYVGNTYNCGSGVSVGDGYCFRNLNFDNNLLYFPPPYFPTGTQYAIDSWTEE